MSLRIVLILVFIFNFLNANVNIEASNTFIKGEPYTFSISVRGSNIKFPTINNIDSYKVQVISNTSSTSIINSHIIKKIQKTFLLYPKADFTIPSLQFEVDNKKVVLKSKKVKMSLPKKTKSKFFDLEVKSSKDTLYLGEQFLLTVKFKNHNSVNIEDIGLVKPSLQNFWYEKIEEVKQYDENGYYVNELKYLMFPQTKGNIEIEPFKVQVVYQDSVSSSFFSTNTKSMMVYSNSLNLDIKQLPKDVTLVGNFNIKTNISKTTIDSMKPVVFTIDIKGKGNIEDLKDLNLDIKDATIYSNSAKIKRDKKHNFTYSKKFTILSNSSYKIPSFSFEYFNSDKNKVEKIATKEYEIKVNEVAKDIQQKDRVLQKVEPKQSEKKQEVKIVEKTSTTLKFIYFVLGVITTLLILSLIYYVIKSRQNKKVEQKPLIKRVKSSKDRVDLLKTLSVYININKDLDRLIFELENTKDFLKVKKEIIKVLKEIDIRKI